MSIAMFRFTGSMLAIAMAGGFVCTTVCADESVHRSFQSELSSILAVAKTSKRLDSVYAGEQPLAGEVIEIMPDAFLLKSQQGWTYLIRIDRIDSVGWQAPSSANVPE